MGTDNVGAIQQNTINQQVFASTFSVSWSERSLRVQSGISKYYTQIAAFLCDRTSKNDPVNCFLASSFSLKYSNVAKAFDEVDGMAIVAVFLKVS